MFVIKASGRREEFDKEKIRSTCRRAGAPEWLADKIADRIEKKVRDGMRTKEILKMTLLMLDKEMPHIAAMYDLKGAIMRLGPAGYEFEKFVSELLKRYGYKTVTNVIVKGKCVSHEVDVISEKGSEKTLIECKYHNSLGTYTGVHEVLYTKARFDDVINSKDNKDFTNCQIVSNTRFSSDAIKYAKCMKIKLLSWDYPKENIRTMLEDKRLYPITIIKNLSKYVQDKLISNGIVFCIELFENDISDLSSYTGISKKRLIELREEAEKIISKSD